MRATDEFIVIHGQHGIRRVQEFGMEDDLNTVRRMIEELHTTNLVQDGILVIVHHVMSNNRRQRIALHGKEASTQENAVLGGDEILLIWHGLTIMPLKGTLEDTLANAAFDDVDGVSERLDDGLASESFDGERMGLGWHDDEGYHRHL